MTNRIRPILNLLSRKEKAFYKAHNCGVCVATKTIHGRRATLGLSSELTFVSLLLEGLEAEPYAPGRSHCPILFFVPRSILVAPPHHQRAMAAGVLASLQLDLADAREDKERRLKRWLCRGLAARQGEIDPAAARQAPWARAALEDLPRDDVGEIVAGVIGEIFRMAGHPGPVVSTACRMGHAMGQLMSLTDALDDYFSDQAADKANVLRSPGGPPKISEAEATLRGAIDQLFELLCRLPLRRHLVFLTTLVDVHARARVEVALDRFRDKLPERAAPAPGAPWHQETPREPVPSSSGSGVGV